MKKEEANENNETIKKVEKKADKKKLKKEKKKEQKRLKKEKRKKSKAWKIFKITLILLLIAFIIFAGIFAYRFMKNGGGLQGFLATAMGHDENTLKDLDKIYFLLVGISGYEEDYKLADTIMLCSYDPKVQKASILSIPRDTYVGKNKKKASASYKINAVYRNGENIDGMVEAIEDITDIQIDNYLIVDTDALIQIVDAIGGVEFNVPIDMKYDDVTQDLHIDLKAGYQKLNGEQAEWLVRFRHNNDGTSYPTEYGDNDIGRMRTQREFITATLQQTLKPENIVHLTKVAEIAFDNITTNMTFQTIKDYIPYAVSFSTENLQTNTLPGTPELVNGVWIYTVDKKETAKIVEELFADEEIPEEVDGQNTINTNTISGNTSENTNENKKELKIEVLNGTGKSSNLTKVTKILKQNGYNVIKTGNTNTTTKTQIINRTNQSSKTTKELKEILEVGTTSEKSNNSNVDYTIILGKDYE